MQQTVQLKGLDKAAVLAALYNASRAQGMGFMHYDPTPMTVEEARALLESDDDFDYLRGRVMKINLDGDELDTWAYDRDNGEGCVAKVIASLRETGDVNSPLIQQIHKHGVLDATQETSLRMGEGSYMERRGNKASLHLGLSDMANVLGPKIQEAEGHHTED